MKLDRLAFLALASSLAAVACSSSSENTDDDTEGALRTEGACTDPGRATPLPNTSLATCDELVRVGEQAGEDGPSLKSVCTGYLTNFKANAAEAARKCISKIKPEPGGRGMLLDWETLYGCGYESLFPSCNADGAAAECDALVAQMKDNQRYTHDNKTDVESVKAECTGALSGLVPAARAKVKECITRQGFPVYSCIEGIDPAANAKICVDPTSRPKNEDGKVAVRADNRFQCFYLPGPTMEGMCVALIEAARIGPGAEIAKRMRAAGELSPNNEKSLQNVYNAGLSGLRATCPDDSVNAQCAELVKKYTAAGQSNAGGRITRECRTLFPGLLKAARDKIVGGAVPRDGRIATALVAVPAVGDAADDAAAE
jgi:hypothetical protein